MNFNLYLDRESAEQLDRLAHKTRRPRNALIREAVRTWLYNRAAAWPKEVVDFAAEPSLVPFEAHRATLGAEPPDPFAPAALARTTPRRRSRRASGT
jgi:hypothetical protein